MDDGQNKRAKVDASTTKSEGAPSHAPSHEKSTPKVDNLSNKPSSLSSNNNTGIKFNYFVNMKELFLL